MDTNQPFHNQLHILGVYLITVTEPQPHHVGDDTLQRIVSLTLLSQPPLANGASSTMPARSSHRTFLSP